MKYFVGMWEHIPFARGSLRALVLMVSMIDPRFFLLLDVFHIKLFPALHSMHYLVLALFMGVSSSFY